MNSAVLALALVFGGVEEQSYFDVQFAIALAVVEKKHEYEAHANIEATLSQRASSPSKSEGNAQQNCENGNCKVNLAPSRSRWKLFRR